MCLHNKTWWMGFKKLCCASSHVSVKEKAEGTKKDLWPHDNTKPTTAILRETYSFIPVRLQALI